MIQRKQKAFFTFLLTFAVALALLFPGSQAYATDSNNETTTEPINQHVYDKAELLSTSEIEELEQMCIDKGKEAGVEIILLTDSDPDEADPDTYIENFEDQLPVANRVYTYIDMSNRKVWMEGYGTAEQYMNSDRITEITDAMVPYLKNQNYYDAFTLSIDRTVEFMHTEPEVNNGGDDGNNGYNDPGYNDPDTNYNNNGSGYIDNSSNSGGQILTKAWVQLLIALVIGGVVVGVMAYNAGGRMTTGGNTYMDPNHSGLIGRRDDYLHTQVTRVRKPQNNNTGSHGGGGGGGISAGGRSHSSGGSSF